MRAAALVGLVFHVLPDVALDCGQTVRPRSPSALWAIRVAAADIAITEFAPLLGLMPNA